MGYTKHIIFKFLRGNARGSLLRGETRVDSLDEKKVEKKEKKSF